jgi:plasmid stabilization system protein ParE
MPGMKSKRRGLGDEFAECVQEQLRYLEKNPKVHAEIYKNARRAVVRRFPYLVYYAIKGSRVQVASVIRASRKSARWKKWFD